VSESTVDVVFEGADSGSPVPDVPPSQYGRSLPVDLARHPDMLLAYEMNGEPLPEDHGYPLRLVVPGWYGMASVKWLTRISLVDRPYEGFFQKDRYVLDTGNDLAEPLAHMLVKSLFSRPRHGQVFEQSPLEVAGLAWSGLGEIVSVEISQDSGETWAPAELGGLAQKYTWRQWNARWTPAGKGHHTLMVRASDALGNLQPMENRWNRLGYAVNAAQSVCVNVM
jgi:DMSO/TMAO reductase YedYZ molybdopterin-dependent catalytic subunit